MGRNLRDSNHSTSDIEQIQRSLLAWEPIISDFWNFPKIQDFLEININRKILRISDRAFDIPVLIELTDELETTLEFPPNCSEGHEKIILDRLRLDENRPFILIDHCANLYEYDKNSGFAGFCLLAANGKNYLKTLRLYGNAKFTSNAIRELLELQPNF